VPAPSCSACGLRAPRSSSLLLRATGSRPARGRICCVTASGVACGRPCWLSATVRWDSGRRCGRCSQTPGSNAAGSTRSQTSCPRCPSPRIPARRRPWPRSGTPRAVTTPAEQARSAPRHRDYRADRTAGLDHDERVIPVRVGDRGPPTRNRAAAPEADELRPGTPPLSLTTVPKSPHHPKARKQLIHRS
jgi:hypothetical protein